MPTNALIMVRPACFGSNPETLEDNAFQKPGNNERVAAEALNEFDLMVSTLRSKGMEVLVLEDTGDPITYDSVFPNNWFSTHPDGKLFLYPMKSPIRRKERRPEFISQMKREFVIDQFIDLSAHEQEGTFLEGTGSMVLDHDARVAYMCRSERSSEALLHEFCERSGFRPFVFDCLIDGKAVYHTNVIMGIGRDYVIACSDAIMPKESFVEQVKSTGKLLISISIDQVKSFLGNCLEVAAENGKNFLVMSSTAYQSLTSEQKTALEKFVHLLPISIPTIETYGGGSVRCMIAENYLTKQEQQINA